MQDGLTALTIAADSKHLDAVGIVPLYYFFHLFSSDRLLSVPGIEQSNTINPAWVRQRRRSSCSIFHFANVSLLDR